ncbi:hypothetical protein BMS3Abin04_00573 [bacterium BMS3Abin04]|nr:hypothetical protein BMS3Abin04_00573 [bacterium BMS3Abin04]
MILKNILLAKIIITTIFWAAPLLFAPPDLFVLLGIPVPHPILFIRLLGAAYFSLIFVYVYGYRLLKAKRNPLSAELSISTGIVSSGLAFIVLFYLGISGSWAEWGLIGQIYMWGSVVLTFMLTAGLYLGFKFKK